MIAHRNTQSLITKEERTVRPRLVFARINSGPRTQLLIGEEASSAIGTRAEEPWLRRVEAHVEDAQPACVLRMPTKNLHGNDERVLHQVRVPVGKKEKK
jgi:hypothetical protein